MNHELTLEDQQTCVIFYPCGHIEESLLKYHHYYLIFTILMGLVARGKINPKCLWISIFIIICFSIVNHLININFVNKSAIITILIQIGYECSHVKVDVKE